MYARMSSSTGLLSRVNNKVLPLGDLCWDEKILNSYSLEIGLGQKICSAAWEG